MVKRYAIAGIEGTTPPGWHEYVLAADYDALEHQSISLNAASANRIASLEGELARCRSAIAHDTEATRRIAALETALRYYAKDNNTDYRVAQAVLEASTAETKEESYEPPSTQCRECGLNHGACMC